MSTSRSYKGCSYKETVTVGGLPPNGMEWDVNLFRVRVGGRGVGGMARQVLFPGHAGNSWYRPPPLTLPPRCLVFL